LTMLFTAMNKQNNLFIWPIKLEDGRGRLDPYNRSAMLAAERAQRKWIRVAANTNLGVYDIYEATAEWPEPVWPKVSFREILDIAFKDKLIDSYEHPALRRLRGEV